MRFQWSVRTRLGRQTRCKAGDSRMRFRRCDAKQVFQWAFGGCRVVRKLPLPVCSRRGPEKPPSEQAKAVRDEWDVDVHWVECDKMSVSEVALRSAGCGLQLYCIALRLKWRRSIVKVVGRVAVRQPPSSHSSDVDDGAFSYSTSSRCCTV